MKAVFLDRDGTITVGTPTYERVDSLEKVELLPNTLQALTQLAELDYLVFLVTNQAGLAEGLITIEQFNAIHDKVLELIEPSGVRIAKTYLCPHGNNSDCECRKPKPGLLFDAAKEFSIDLSESWMIGDRPSDVLAGVEAGTKTILVKTGDPSVESAEATLLAPTLLEAVQLIESAEAHNICLVTDTNNPLDGDELLFLEALKADSFFEVDVQPWDDPAVDWSRFHSVIIRTAWDYTKTVSKFITWSKSVAVQGVDVINSPDVIEWNANKRYLLDLKAAGVPLLPTILVEKSSPGSLVLPESSTGWIVKPTVGASAKGVKRFDKDSADDVRKYVAELIESDVDVLIQPFAEEIANGEVSFVFFGDQYSHACKKTPAEGDFRVQFEYGGHDKYFDANPDQIAQARAVLEATPFNLLYARVDMLEVDGQFVLMELEAIEPYLFFGYNQAPQVFLSVLKTHLGDTIDLKI